MGPSEKLAVLLCLVWTAMTAVFWTIILAMPGGWSRKVCSIYMLDAGLYQVRTKPGVVTGLVGHNRLVDILTGLTGQQAFAQKLCLKVKVDLACQIATRLLYSSWFMLFCGLVGVFVLAGGGYALYYWAYLEPRKIYRKSAKICFCIAAVFFFVGVLQYLLVARDLKEMPPMTSGGTLSRCSFAAGILTMASFVPIYFMVFIVSESAEEASFEAGVEQKRLAREWGQQGQMYGTQPQQGQQVPMYGAHLQTCPYFPPPQSVAQPPAYWQPRV
uniref:Uncharacterized protein n=1 Tax=Pyrodinium bahamense TaxID=73915 RepID=A0A7S0AL46_9DINO